MFGVERVSGVRRERRGRVGESFMVVVRMVGRVGCRWLIWGEERKAS